MNAEAKRFSLLVTGPEMDGIGPGSLCFALPAFPPPDDFPMMVDQRGEATCRYGDSKWLIGGRSFSFGADSSDLRSGKWGMNNVNGELLKRCVVWFMYGDRRRIRVASLSAYHQLLKPIFAFCSGLARPISASDLSIYYNGLEEELAQVIRPSQAKLLMDRLYELWLARDILGFTLLEPKQISRLTQLIPVHLGRQTQFIPPRIWAYQAGRLLAFLQDFLAHKKQFEEAFCEVLDAYRGNYGSLAKASNGSNKRNPFRKIKRVRGCTYLGSFTLVADRHRIRDVLVRWLFPPGTVWDQLGSCRTTIQLLSQYFNAIGLVGGAYLQCFSAMRHSEIMSLRCGCLSIENDPILGEIHILSGETTKTTQDDDARWLAAPTVALAVEAMSIVARWRAGIAAELEGVSLTSQDKVNPYLIQRGREPWIRGGGSTHRYRSAALRPSGNEMTRWAAKVPGLFEEESLRITEEDATYVRRFSANADMSKYGEGCVWNLTSHQYRRTAAVMMGASQVSLEAQQYQFKHLTRNQSAYYRRGFQSLRLNRTLTYELVQVRYEMVSLELGLLNGPEYVSPISPARKDEILNFHEFCSGDDLQKAIKKGHLAVKQTLFGVCTRRDRCPYGGHDNIAHCTDCNDALLSRRKRSGIVQLGKTIAVRLVDAPLGTALRAQLERSAKAIERYMDVTA